MSKPKKELPYHKTFTLLADIPNVECWNWTSGKTVTLPKGATLKVIQVYDATHTTCSIVDEKGETVEFAPSGYRWIINNTALSKAIGAYVPRRTGDLVGDLIAYESGESSPKQTARLFKKLRKTGIGRKLQGHYSSRM